jgi:hypothetical protein
MPRHQNSNHTARSLARWILIHTGSFAITRYQRSDVCRHRERKTFSGTPTRTRYHRRPHIAVGECYVCLCRLVSTIRAGDQPVLAPAMIRYIVPMVKRMLSEVSPVSRYRVSLFLRAYHMSSGARRNSNRSPPMPGQGGTDSPRVPPFW